jgi:hypothetical protein
MGECLDVEKEGERERERERESERASGCLRPWLANCKEAIK